MTTAQRIVVDPITRIEGHLRIEAQTDGGKIAQAYSAGTMVRGIEIILRGRDPRDAWAFAQRICGVCTLVHGLASIRRWKCEARHPKYPIPPNAQIIRNLMIGGPVRARPRHALLPPACPGLGGCGQRPERRSQGDLALAQSISSYPKSSPGYFADVQKRSRPSSSRANWASSPMVTGATRPTSCRPKPT
jgi:hydrogenase large subunit